jgi:hypothetical protein
MWICQNEQSTHRCGGVCSPGKELGVHIQTCVAAMIGQGLVLFGQWCTVLYKYKGAKSPV